MIDNPDDYFLKGCGRCPRYDTPDCSTRRWTEGLATLRSICLDAGLAETAKWGHPVYMHAERNVAIIGAYLGDFRLGFMKAVLIDDHAGLLERSGPHTRHPDIIRFTSGRQVTEREPVIMSYLRQGMDHAERGTKPPPEAHALELPDELFEALEADPELGAAFAALTPGRQRSYVIALGSAKTAATRVARIAKLRDKILSGKGATER